MCTQPGHPSLDSPIMAVDWHACEIIKSDADLKQSVNVQPSYLAGSQLSLTHYPIFAWGQFLPQTLCYPFLCPVLPSHTLSLHFYTPSLSPIISLLLVPPLSSSRPCFPCSSLHKNPARGSVEQKGLGQNAGS